MEEIVISLIVFGVIFLICIIPGCIIQVNEYERGVLFSRGKFKRVLKPGWHFKVPIFQSFRKVYIRTKADDVPA